MAIMTPQASSVQVPGERQRGRSTLENVALALGIARDVIGTGLDVYKTNLQRKQAGWEMASTGEKVGPGEKGTKLPGLEGEYRPIPSLARKVQELGIQNAEGDIAEERRKRTPLTPEQMSDAASFFERNGVKVEPADVPTNVGEYERMKNSVIGRSQITPAQNESILNARERLALAREAAEAAKAERERKAAESTSGRFMAGGYGARMLDSEKVMTGLYEQGFNRAGLGAGAVSILPNFMNVLKPSELQQQNQAERNFVNATLRKESGAVISPSEFANAELQYFPRAGDTPEVLKQKKENRIQVIRTMMSEAGPVVRKAVLKEGMEKFYDDLIHGDGERSFLPPEKDVDAELKRRGL